ncbi:MAG: GrpB family protein [Acidimicrobiales bacterium]
MAERPVVVAHRPDWERRAAAVMATLRADLGDGALRIDHIGSTAIPSMPAKDVLDLQVSVRDLELATRDFDAPLVRLGFQRAPHEADHVPAGRDDDPADWAKRLWLRRGRSVDGVNLHVRRVGSPNERLALLFRDWFRAHPGAVPAYGRFKQSLADVAVDLDRYVDVKDPVVDLVVVVAELWAVRTGWRP